MITVEEQRIGQPLVEGGESAAAQFLRAAGFEEAVAQFATDLCAAPGGKSLELSRSEGLPAGIGVLLSRVDVNLLGSALAVLSVLLLVCYLPGRRSTRPQTA